MDQGYPIQPKCLPCRCTDNHAVEYGKIIDMRYEKSCGTIIINQNKVLVIGARNDEGKLFWSFPKGHQENGETDIGTAVRETLEEVGLRTEIVDQMPIFTNHLIHGGTAVKDIYLFLAKIKDGEIKPQDGEVELVKWVDFTEADEYFSDYYKDAWGEAKKRISMI